MALATRTPYMLLCLPETPCMLCRSRLLAHIRELSIADRLWGAPRVHGGLQKLGIAVSQSTVAKYMKRPVPPRKAARVLSIEVTRALQ